MTAPIHTWKSSKLKSAGITRIAVGPVGVASRATSTIASDQSKLEEAAQKLQQALQITQPTVGPNFTAFYPGDLERASSIQLVSYDNQPNDSATLGAARKTGAELILQANIVDANLDAPPPIHPTGLRSMLFPPKPPPEYLVVHWSIIDTQSGQRIHEETISLDRDSLDKQNIEMNYQLPGNSGAVLMGASKSGWGLVTNMPKQTEATLALPWIWAGSSQVRKGNGYAKQGRWDLAEREWQSAADLHPTNKAAWHNLSLAAVAKEDFELARNRLRHANDYWPGDSTFKTQLWLEKQQREYHTTMNLNPPASGWQFPDSAFLDPPK